MKATSVCVPAAAAAGCCCCVACVRLSLSLLRLCGVVGVGVCEGGGGCQHRPRGGRLWALGSGREGGEVTAGWAGLGL